MAEKKIIARKLYKHFSGKIFVCLGFAKDMQTKTDKVIMSDCDPVVDEIITTDVSSFFELKDGKPRFELVAP